MVFLDDIDADICYFNTDSQCSYYGTRLMKEKFSSDENSLKILHLNIRSANKNFNEFQLSLHKMSIDYHIIVLTETWFDIVEDWNELPGYTAYHAIRDCSGGGMTVLVSTDLQSEEVTELSIVNDIFEACAVKILANNKEYLLVGVYRTPSGSCTEFNLHFPKILDNRLVSTCNTIITGDFNIDIGEINYSTHTRDFVSEMRSANFLPMITIPTRVTSTSATVIDHIWCNFTVPCMAGVVICNVTDHYPTFIVLPSVFVSRPPLIKVTFRDHSERNILLYSDRVKDYCNRFVVRDNDDINMSCRNFCEHLFYLYKNCFPIKCKYISQKRLMTPWLTDALLKCIDRKHKLYRLSRVNAVYVNIYRQYRNVLCSTIAAAKKQYFTNKFENCKSDIRATWRSVNHILKPNRNKKQFPTLNVDGQKISGEANVAECFNNYFSKVGSKLDSEVPVNNIDPLSFVNRQSNSFAYLPTDASEIISIVSSMKPSGSNVKVIPSFIFKKIMSFTAPVIASLINASVSVGVFPDVLKVARVIPLFKSGKKDDLTNYRPISTLSFLSKIFEKIIYTRLYSFLVRYDILTNEQFGFQKNKSTCDAVLHFVNCVYTALNSKNSLVSVLLDFSKAFDTVNHSILVSKLEALGVRGSALSWLTSYLANRRQYVAIGDVQSSIRTIDVGVPQGSVLGPLLFLIYINDMSRCTNRAKFIHFADDTAILLEGTDFNNIFSTLNEELDHIYSWLCCNRLSLNEKKSFFIVFSNTIRYPNREVKIGRFKIDQVDRAKYLGIIIDNELSFRHHIDYVVQKVSACLGILRRLSQYTPNYVLRTIYLSLIYPHLMYGVEVWGGSRQTVLCKLRSRQDKSVRLCSGAWRDDINAVYAQSRLLPFEEVYKYFVRVRFYQYCKWQRNVFFTDSITDLRSVHNYQTRFAVAGKLNVPHYRLSLCHCSFLFKAVHYWNDIPISIRDSPSVSIFKARLRRWYRDVNAINF